MVAVHARSHGSRKAAVMTVICSRLPALGLLLLPAALVAQDSTKGRPMRPEDTEVWTPVPKVITPGREDRDPPSDAIVLFDGKNLDAWASGDGSPARWTVANGMMTVNKPTGDVHTKRTFTNFQMHIEWQIPTNVTGSGQLRGNSGVFLSSGPDASYELQIMDSYENATFANGQAASVYKQSIPLVNAMRRPGEWQTYDIVWTAPVFNSDGSVKLPAYVTAFHNGVLVQDHFALKGVTRNTGLPYYKAHGPEPILLQAHGDPSPPISFRNIWVRELP